MYDKLLLNGEPYISSNGEIICDEYLPENNPMNPESSFGWFIYMIIGRGFDLIDEMSNQFINDLDVTSCNSRLLDKLYGANLGYPRPTIMDGENERLLSDDEYRVYLYIRTCRLMTRLDLMSVFGHCMGDDANDDPYNGVTVTDEPNNQFTAVDHLHYEAGTTDKSNIARNSPDDEDYIVDQFSSDDDVYRLGGRRVYTGEIVTVVNVPSKGWSSAFLDFLVDYISIKGNVLIREVI